MQWRQWLRPWMPEGASKTVKVRGFLARLRSLWSEKSEDLSSHWEMDNSQRLFYKAKWERSDEPNSNGS